MTIADKLNYLNGTKEAIKQAIANKGVEVLETDTFRSYADKIASIEAGGGSGADYKSSLMATTTQSAYSPSIVSLSDYVLPDYTIEKGQTGLLYPKRKTTTFVTENFTKVGDVVIEDKVASGFSTSNYIKLPGIFNPNVSDWEMFFKFNSGSLTATKGIFSVDTYYSLVLGIGTKLCVWTSSNGSSWSESATDNNGITTLKENTDYYLKATYTNNVLNVYLSEDGDVWTTEFTQNISLAPVTSNYSKLGLYRGSGSPLSTGSIDLSESYIKVNNEMYWQPYTVKETDEYDSSNIEKIGLSISISDSNFVSGFDFDNYLKFTHNLTEPIRNLDLIIKGRVSTDNTYQVGIEVLGTSVDWAQWVKIYNSNKLGVLTIGDADSGGFTVLNGVDYWFRCVGAENIFTLYCKRYDGLSIEETKNQDDWTQVFQTSLDKCIGQGINTFTFGRNNKASYSTQYWRGGFDLKNFQFIINDEIVCGYNKYLRGICTKDFMPQVGTNTLNAYHIEYTDGTSECLLGQTEPTGTDIKSVQLLESGITFEEDKAWTYNEDSEQFE